MTGTTTRVSVGSAAPRPTVAAAQPSISADGRYVAFGLGAIEPGGRRHQRRRTTCSCGTRWPVRDQAGQRRPAPAPRPTATATTRRSRRTAGTSPSCRVREPGRRRHQPQLRRVRAGHGRTGVTTARVSVGQRGAQGQRPQLRRRRSRADGRYVAFASARRTWSPATPTARRRVRAGHGRTGITTRVSVDSPAAPRPTADSDAPSISRRRPLRRVRSRRRSNLVAGDTNDRFDVFVRDTVNQA